MSVAGLCDERKGKIVPLPIDQPVRLRKGAPKRSKVSWLGIHLGGKAMMSGAGPKAVMPIQ